MGNKAKNLIELQEAGFNVPELIACEDSISNEASIIQQVKEKLPNIDLFAVRSSAMNEDSAEKSMAGYFYSAVGVTYQNLFEEYQKVVKSFEGQAGKVIIQRFIPSEKAGVIFTNRGDNHLIINALPGLCKPVVEGAACDEYIIAENGDLTSKQIAREKYCLFFSDNQINIILLKDTETLTESEIQILIKTAKQIEKHFGTPQDIEWCFLDNQLLILQSRPITKSLISENNKVFYDSANIAESYSGIILPLTISFARNIYKTVYENLLVASGLSKQKIRKHQDIFQNMVASFYGRIYYNMNNWYLMMSFMPGYDRNKANLEEMITSNIRDEIRRAVMPTVWLKISYPFILIFKVLTFGLAYRNFTKKVKKYLDFYRKADISIWSFERCKSEYAKLSENLLGKWHIPVENDFMVMTYLGMLKKKYDEETLKKIIRFGNISSRQVNALQKLSKLFYEVDKIAEAIDDKDVETFESEVNSHPELKEKLKNYFETYGGRFANELKLESADISEDTRKMLSVFQLYHKYKAPQAKTTNAKTSEKESVWALKKFKKFAAQREELRLLRSNTFAAVRRLLNQMGNKLTENEIISTPKDIYYLSLDEIFDNSLNQSIKQEILSRKKKYE